MTVSFDEQDSTNSDDDSWPFARERDEVFQQPELVREANLANDHRQWFTASQAASGGLTAWRDSLEPLKYELRKTRISVDDATKRARQHFTIIEELRETLAARTEELQSLNFELAGHRRKVDDLREELVLVQDQRRRKLEDDRERLEIARKECAEDAERLGQKVGKEKQVVQVANAKHKQIWEQQQAARERKIRAVVLAFDDVSSWALRLFGSEPEPTVSRWLESLREILRTLLKECTVAIDPNASTSHPSADTNAAAKRLQEATHDMVDHWVATASRARAGATSCARAPELNVTLREERATAERLEAALATETLKTQALEAELVEERELRKAIEEERTTFAPFAAQELQKFDKQSILLRRENEAAIQKATAMEEAARSRRKQYRETVERYSSTSRNFGGYPHLN